MKRIKQYEIFLFLFVILPSCYFGRKNKDSALEYWSSNNNGEITFSRKTVEAWNLLHPDHTLKYQPIPEGQSSEEIILAAVVGKTTPDIYSNMWQGSVELYSLPQTYSEYLSAAEKFKKDFDGDGYVDQWFGNASVKLSWYQRLFNFYPLYIGASDGLPLVKDNKACFNNKYAIEVFRFLQEVYKQNYFSKDQQSDVQDPFIEGKIATKFTGPWE